MSIFIRLGSLLSMVIFFYSFALPTFAEGNSSRFSNMPGTELAAAFGHSRISANELVYMGSGAKYLSHLHWNASAPVIRLSASHDLPPNWSLSGGLMFSIAGNADLTNRDWIDFDHDGPFRPGSGSDDWTHRSQHPNSDLLRYIDLDVILGRDVQINEITSVNLHGGLKYNLVEFTAKGGDYIYSQNGFRNHHYTLPDAIPVINYQQWHRTVFAGTELTYSFDDWRFSGLIRAGLSPEPRDIDQHLQRNLRFDERYDTATFAQARLGLARKIRNDTLIFANVNYQKYFEERGDFSLSTINDGTPLGYVKDSIGADMSVTTIEIGMAHNF